MTSKRVLVVEDDPSVVVFIADSLEYLEYDVVVAIDGKDGLEKAKALTPDLVILDVMMPEMNGFEVCEKLKSNRKTKNIPILMLTAKGHLQDKVKGFDVGADDYLPKPYEKDEFESRVKALLRRSINSNQNDEKAASTLLFLSYARADISLVKEIYQNLSNNYKPWMDVYDIVSGEDWIHAIYTAIDKCDLFIPILSKNSVDRRGMIVKEVKRALDKWNGMLPNDIYVIPIRIDNCRIPDLVKHLQVIDWEEGKGMERLSQAIDLALKRLNQW